MNYYFEWDPRKAGQNVRKHDVTFQRAATVFSDLNLVSLFDEVHSRDEERWVTIGMDHSGNILVVVHTLEALGADEAKLRIISARKATPAEIDAYEQHFR
jgi:uncharacterized DUF497 family protein